MQSPEAGVADVGLVGLAVMGQNLALNMADHGFRTAVQNRTTSVTEQFLRENPGTPGGLVGCATPADLAKALKRPRRAVILVKAGKATDAVIDGLADAFEEGDLIVDGGNAYWEDTLRRTEALKKRGIRFIGSGVSGGEVGARFGPSLMAGGDRDSWAMLEPVWKAIAAKVDPKTGREITGAAPGMPVSSEGVDSCAALVGPGASGHYVKMVHNGIEYGDMQMICEAYDLLRRALSMEPAQIGEVFSNWNSGDLDSFLVQITADILAQRDPVTGKPFVDVVLDVAGQKGTGKWTSVSALDLGVPAATIAEAVFARCMSAEKEQRVQASGALAGPADRPSPPANKEAFINDVRDALLCSKICSYAQGFALMTAWGREHGWTPDFATIAGIWRGGCIIRAAFLHRIAEAYHSRPDLPNLLLDPYFKGVLSKAQAGWRRVVAASATSGVPMPTFSSALAYYDSYRSERLPASLLQAQRDYFGAHTYERVDQPRGRFFHLDWPDPNRPQVEA